MGLLTNINQVYAENSAQKRQMLELALRDELARMAPEARAKFQRAVDLWVRGGATPDLLALQVCSWAPDYIRTPVSVREFVKGEEYLGLGVGRDTFERIIEDLEELFVGEYTEVILAGSIGWGKTREAEIAIAYDLYQISCLRDPAVSLGLMSGSTIAFVNCSVQVEQARKVLFAGLASMLSKSYYFTQVFPYDMKLKSELKFPRSVRCYPVAASEQAQLGEGIFSAAIDEANFMQVIEESKRRTPGAEKLFDQAESVYNKLKARIRSRVNLLGKLPCHIFLISSARYPNDFTERMEKLAREGENRRFMFVRHWTAWQTNPKKFLPGRFQVEVGDLTRRSRVLNGSESDVNQERVIDVPIDLKPEFLRATEACVRDYAGIATLSIKPFISRRESIQQMFELGRIRGVEHPFTAQNVTLQLPDPEAEHLLPEKLHWIEQPVLDFRNRPLLKDGKPVTERVLHPSLRHAHVDLSKSKDATGICILHVVDRKNIPRLDWATGKYVEETKPIMQVDLLLRVVAPENGQIDIPAIRAIFYKLRALGMQFGKITFDTFGSQESVKTLQDQGFDSHILSVDSDVTPYDELRCCLYDQRLISYYDPILERELAQLEDVGKKIDHSPNGSKDLSDALAGAVHHAEASWASGEAARGLFQIGIVERPGESSQATKNTIESALEKIGEGKALSDDEENAVVFVDLDQML